MTVVWGVVKDHGGYIDVLTEEGSGTSFVFYFFASREEMKPSATVYIEEHLGRGESILVVDDIAEQRDLAKRMLQRLGYDVSTAPSGEDAAVLIREGGRVLSKPSLLLLWKRHSGSGAVEVRKLYRQSRMLTPLKLITTAPS